MRLLLRAIAPLLAGVLLVVFPPVSAHTTGTEDDAHGHHHHHVAPATVRSTVDVQVPDIVVVRSDGRAVRLRDEIELGLAVEALAMI